ncbi:Valine--pyruvate aminotransferase [Clarireedia jacksonii]
MTKHNPASTPPKKQINLLRGWPNTSLLPTTQLQKSSNRVFEDASIAHPALLYGPDPGPQSLRESVAKWLRGFYSDYYDAAAVGSDAGKGRTEHAERICITGGASQNLACLLQVFSDPVVTKVWMVTPGYFLAGRIFDDSGLVVRAVGEGSEGVDLEGLESHLKEERSNEGNLKPLKNPKPWSKIYKNIIYCVPTFSNPSGKTMSLACRTQLVRLAREYDALLISDDVYDFLQWSTDPSSSTTPNKKAFLPRLVDIDRTLEPVPGENDFGNAVSNGSFSKIAGPGVRTGWAEATPRLVYGLSQTGSSRSGGSPSQLTATVVNELLSSGDLEKHVYEVLQPAYRQRWRTMMEMIERELAGLGVKAEKGEEMFGGYFLWLVLPEGVDSSLVADVALQKENLVVAPGKIFEVVGDESVKLERGLRLCFACEEEADLAEGVSRLARVVRGVMDKGGLESNETYFRLDFKQAAGEFS